MFLDFITFKTSNTETTMNCWNILQSLKSLWRCVISALFFIVRQKHVTQCSNVARWCVFSRFWTTMELYDTDKSAKPDSGLNGHNGDFMQFIVGFSECMGCFEGNKGIENHSLLLQGQIMLM